MLLSVLIKSFRDFRSGSCTNPGSFAVFDPNDVTIEMKRENEKTLDYLNTTLNKYLDFLRVNSKDSSEVVPIKINVDIGKA